MAINMQNEFRAPLLKPCEGCGGTADYFYAGDGNWNIVARCLSCGRQTRPFMYASGAGDDWNRRITSGARVVTLFELAESEMQQSDAYSRAAVWIENREGDIVPAVLEFGIDLGETTVHEYGGQGDWEWSREQIGAEGEEYRLWDRLPTEIDRAVAPWGRPAWEEIRAKKSRESVERALGKACGGDGDADASGAAE